MSSSVLSYGVFVPKEAFCTLHSSFSKADNYVFENIVISFVSPDIGGGPSNIVLKSLPPDPSEMTVFSSGGVFAFGREYLFNPETLYDSHVSAISPDFFNLPFNFNIFPKKSLAFLLNPTQERFLTSTFEKAFVEKAKSGFSLLKKSSFEEGAAELSGLGNGLTPAGDDFLTGLLSALYLIEFNPAARTAIFNQAQTQNAISNTFLKAAYEGHFYAPLKNFIENPSDEHLKRILSHGSTSGADMLVGFIFGLSLR